MFKLVTRYIVTSVQNFNWKLKIKKDKGDNFFLACADKSLYFYLVGIEYTYYTIPICNTYILFVSDFYIKDIVLNFLC